LPQADERDVKVAALSRQVELVPLRPLLIADPLEDSFVDQPAKALGEHLSCGAETALELVEATQSQQSVPNDQQCPALPDDLEGVCDRASDQLVWEERGMPVHLLPAYGAGIQIHVEHLADYISGRELRNVEVRWNELFPAYEALGIS
jgi:hypothetical protein